MTIAPAFQASILKIKKKKADLANGKSKRRTKTTKRKA